MSKYKIVTQKGRKLFVLKSEKGQQLSEREIYIINNDEAKGFLHFFVEQTGATYKLSYDITGLITLDDYLGSPLTKSIFVKLIQNIFAQLKIMKELYFRQEALMLEFDKVMVKATTGELLFLYVPIPSYRSETSLREFFLNIIRKCTFVPNENNNYVQDYIRILNRGINFSLFELEEYITKLSEVENEVQQEIQCPFCKAIVPHGTYYCPRCGNNIANQKCENEKKLYNPLNEVQSVSQQNVQPVQQRRPQPAEVPIPHPDQLATLQSIKAKRNGVLVRNRTGEQIRIEKDVFRIGKGTIDNDYYILDNGAISRSHAMFMAKGEQWTIIDLNSTNGTYVNGSRIMPQSEVVLMNGSTVGLADEQFVFYLQ